MAKMSLFFCFFLFALIAMPISSSSRMIIEVGVEVGGTKSCPPQDCSQYAGRGCPPASGFCPPLVCPNGVFLTCCGCNMCC
ncbi:hypothetical protein MKW92_000862 [Papaver armeniacum]|nr:hypothetical protein MKW92_000862 [Papaver armeniacum]